MLAEQINKNMCGVVCPCDETLMEPWLAMTEEELNVYGRTKNPKPSSAGPTETEDADGNAWFIFDTDESKTVKTYLECVKKAAEFFKANEAAAAEALAASGAPVVVPTEEEKIKQRRMKRLRLRKKRNWKLVPKSSDSSRKSTPALVSAPPPSSTFLSPLTAACQQRLASNTFRKRSRVLSNIWESPRLLLAS